VDNLYRQIIYCSGSFTKRLPPPRDGKRVACRPEEPDEADLVGKAKPVMRGFS
jgi:hypothetical protein